MAIIYWKNPFQVEQGGNYAGSIANAKVLFTMIFFTPHQMAQKKEF
jgi:hypothetical protein